MALTALSSGGFPCSAQAPTLTAAELARLVDAHYDHLQSLQTRYTERFRGMGMDHTETGTLLLRKPGRMRWSYDAPAGKVFVLNGADAISYTPGDAQANRLPAKQLDDMRSPLRFLLGHAQLARELENLSVTPVVGGFRLSGAPKGMSARVRSVSLTVNATGVIQNLQVDEVSGATTGFDFTEMHENVPAPDSAFRFDPPPGVSVVKGAAPM